MELEDGVISSIQVYGFVLNVRWVFRNLHFLVELYVHKATRINFVDVSRRIFLLFLDLEKLFKDSRVILIYCCGVAEELHLH